MKNNPKQTSWKNIRARLNKSVQDGLSILKEGGESAWHLAEETGQLLETQTDIHRLKSSIAKLNQHFGKEVHKTLKKGVGRITPVLKKINFKLSKLEQELAKKEKVARSIKRSVKIKVPILKAAKKIAR